jgi:hypothetical protein
MGSRRERRLVFGRVRERKLGGEIEVNEVRILLKDLTESCERHLYNYEWLVCKNAFIRVAAKLCPF